jgi:hypothetical protein
MEKMGIITLGKRWKPWENNGKIWDSKDIPIILLPGRQVFPLLENIDH